MEIISSIERKANKDHVCNFCGCTISKGTKYKHSVNKDGIEIWTWKSHMQCIHLVWKLDMEDASGGVDQDCFIESVHNYYEDKHGVRLNQVDISWQEVMEKVWNAFNLVKNEQKVQGTVGQVS